GRTSATRSVSHVSALRRNAAEEASYRLLPLRIRIRDGRFRRRRLRQSTPKVRRARPRARGTRSNPQLCSSSRSTSSPPQWFSVQRRESRGERSAERIARTQGRARASRARPGATRYFWTRESGGAAAFAFASGRAFTATDAG